MDINFQNINKYHKLILILFNIKNVLIKDTYCVTDRINIQKISCVTIDWYNRLLPYIFIFIKFTFK